MSKKGGRFNGNPWHRGWQYFRSLDTDTATWCYCGGSDPVKLLWAKGLVKCDYNSRNRKITSAPPEYCKFKMEHKILSQKGI